MNVNYIGCSLSGAERECQHNIQDAYFMRSRSPRVVDTAYHTRNDTNYQQSTILCVVQHTRVFYELEYIWIKGHLIQVLASARAWARASVSAWRTASLEATGGIQPFTQNARN